MRSPTGRTQRGAGDRRRESHLARAAEAAGRVGHARRRHRGRRGPAARRAALLGRPVLRLHGDAHGARAADAGTHRRAHARQRRPRRLHADAAGARAAHPPRQGDFQHLHQPGPAGDGRDDLPVAHGRRRGWSASPPQRTRARASSSRRSRACRACGARSAAPAFTRRCCSSIARWRRCWQASPPAASSAAWTLSAHYPELGQALLVCATETKTSADIERYRAALAEALQAARAA